jgi:hypothetical protein
MSVYKLLYYKKIKLTQLIIITFIQSGNSIQRLTQGSFTVTATTAEGKYT